MKKLTPLFRKTISYFLQGLLLIAPVFVTIYSIWAVFNMFDTRANDLFEFIFHFRFPGLGLLVLFFVITLIGIIGSTIFLQPLLHGLELLLEKTPLVKDIYSSIKDFISAFLSNKKKFNKPAIVEMGKGMGIYKLGFIVSEDVPQFKIMDKVAVYFPHSYNFSGNFHLVNKELVQPVHDISSTDFMKYIVTGGVMQMDDDSPQTS